MKRALIILFACWATVLVNEFVLHFRVRSIEQTRWMLITVTNAQGWAWSEVHPVRNPTNKQDVISHWIPR